MISICSNKYFTQFCHNLQPQNPFAIKNFVKNFAKQIDLSICAAPPILLFCHLCYTEPQHEDSSLAHKALQITKLEVFPIPTAKETYTFEQFLESVTPDHLPFIMELDQNLKAHGYQVKVELAKSGYVVSYQHPKTKKVLFNYVFRKSGMFIRLYGDHVSSYMETLQTLPAEMIAKTEKAADCKRLLNPASCNSRCPMGYVFSIGDQQYQKCRYSCFVFAVEEKSLPILKGLVEKEMLARDAS